MTHLALFQYIYKRQENMGGAPLRDFMDDYVEMLYEAHDEIEDLKAHYQILVKGLLDEIKTLKGEKQ